MPAVPALLDQYVEMCSAIFAPSGRGFTSEEVDLARKLISGKLAEAYAGSPRSKIVTNFEAESARPLGYEVRAEISTIADAYERWIGTSTNPLFGTHPDARVLALALEFDDPAACPVLDLGAGTGRNALALAKRGHPVDAVEITPKFAEILATEAAKNALPVRVVAQDVFETKVQLGRNYRLFIASELVPDFRSVADLRRLFELAAEVLTEGGLLVFNLHLAVQGYTPDKAAREFAQQCYSALFTPSEVEQAAAGLSLELLANDSVHDYEQEHLPKEAWPPTPWFINWVSGLDVFDVGRVDCPVELRWLVYKKTDARARGANGTVSEKYLLSNANRSAPATSKGSRARRLDPALLRQALVRRLKRRGVASGTLTLPAIPGLLDTYVEMCFAVFVALGCKFVPEQFAEGRSLFEQVLKEAFVNSPRSNIVVAYEAPMGSELRYTVTADSVPITAAYGDWLESLPAPLFGAYPDARLLSLLEQIKSPATNPVLDIGAGTGRNALALAARGYPVDAVEITPKFAELLGVEAARQNLAVRVFARDIFESKAELGQDYRLMLLSGVVGDFRELSQLRQLFELASDVLRVNGLLLLSVHVAIEGYTPDRAAREWGQQCCAMFFTRSELAQATAGFPLEPVSDDSVYDYEQEHLPEEAWPPTAAFAEWALGQHMYALDREQCPIELRWLVFRKIG